MNQNYDKLIINVLNSILKKSYGAEIGVMEQLGHEQVLRREVKRTVARGLDGEKVGGEAPEAAGYVDGLRQRFGMHGGPAHFLAELVV